MPGGVSDEYISNQLFGLVMQPLVAHTFTDKSIWRLHQWY